MFKLKQKELRNRKKRFRREDISLYLMAAPTLIWLIIFCYIPMVGIWMAFTRYSVKKGIFGSDLVGLKNFKYLFATTDAFTITRNTVLYNVVFIILNMILAVIAALLLNEIRSKKTSKVMQTVYMLPYFLSWTAVSILVTAFLERDNGFVNQLIQTFGGKGLTNWYQRMSIWPGLLVFVNAWKGVGYQTVLFLAVIVGIPKDYYEAAVMDGATRFQQAKYMTIPHLRFVATISIILALGNIFRGDFGLFYTVPKDSGALYGVTDVIDTYVYRGLVNMSNMGMTTAAGVYQSVVGLIVILVANKIVKKIDPDSALF